MPPSPDICPASPGRPRPSRRPVLSAALPGSPSSALLRSPDPGSVPAFPKTWFTQLVIFHGAGALFIVQLVDMAADMKADAGISDRKSTRLNSSHLGISYAVF